MIDVVLNPNHENLYEMITKQQEKKEEINHCSELNCKANDGQGSCRINTCALIDPESAIEELKVLEEENK